MPSSFASVLSSALESSSRLPVSVLVRAVCLNLPEAFLVSPSRDFGIVNALALAGRGCLAPRSRSGKRHSVRPQSRCRNINRLSIDYAFRPRLRHRLTLRRLTLRRNPWVYGERVFHPFYRYSFRHDHSCFVQGSLSVPLRPNARRSPTVSIAAYPLLRCPA